MEANKVSTDGWLDKDGVVKIHAMEYYSAIKIWNLIIWSNMDESRGYYAKYNKSEKEKYRMIPVICGIYKKKASKIKPE